MVKGVVKSRIIPILALAAICLRVAGASPVIPNSGKFSLSIAPPLSSRFNAKTARYV